MAVYSQGAVAPYQISSVIPNEVFGIAINWFAPRTPLLARLNKIPDGSPVFQMVGHKYRPRSGTVNAAIANTTGTALTVVDSSFLMQGDVLKLPTAEYVEVTNVDVTNNVVTLRRAIGGTTPANINNSVVFTLVGNSRTGAEDTPTAIASSLTTATQYMQTIQHPYSVGGGVTSNTLFPIQPGVGTPLEQYKMDAMQNAMDDGEVAAYLGIAEAANTTITRPKMGGLRNLISTNINTLPTNFNSYHSYDFQRDLLTAPRKAGGRPDMVFVASNWMDAFAVWSIPLQKIDQGDTVFGRSITAFATSFMGDVTIVEASLLPPFTAFSLTSDEVRWRVKRPLIDEPYGKSGDLTKGHMLMELAIELDNEFHHAWVEGITGFSS